MLTHPSTHCVNRQLYEVLAARGVAGRRLPLLLAANKADHGPKAHTPDFVRRRLERELCVSCCRKPDFDEAF